MCGTTPPERIHSAVFRKIDHVSNEGSDFDTALYARGDVCLDDGGEVSCNDDSDRGDAVTSQFTLSVRAGATYHFIVDGEDGQGGAVESGNYRLSFTDGRCAVCAQDGECGAGRVCAEGRRLS